MHMSDGYPAGHMSLHYGGYHPGHNPGQAHVSGHAEAGGAAGGASSGAGPGLGQGLGPGLGPGGAGSAHGAVALSGAPGMDPLILPSTGVLNRHLVSQYVDPAACREIGFLLFSGVGVGEGCCGALRLLFSVFPVGCWYA